MGIMRIGTHPVLEAEADRLIRESLKETTRHSEKADILTLWKQQDRYRHEVYVHDGTPDPSVRRGVFGRARNSARPELNSRDGVAQPRSRGGGRSTLADHVFGDDGR